MKKIIFISLIIMALVVPSTVFAIGTGTLSKQCYPAIKCSGTGGKTDAYGTPISCQLPISTVADCPAHAPAYNSFSCSSGCYTMTNPPATPAPSCPSVSVSAGVSAPVISVVNFNGVAQLWDCAAKALFSTGFAVAPNGDISNPTVKNIPGDTTKAQCLTDGGTPTDYVALNPTKCRYPVNVVSGFRIKDHSGNALLKVNDYGQISNPDASAGVVIKDANGLEVWNENTFNPDHYTIDASNGISYAHGDAGIYSPVTINDALDVRYEITNLGGASSPVTFQDADGLKINDTAMKPYPADLHIDPVHGFERYFNDVAYSSSKNIPNTLTAIDDCYQSGDWPTRLNTTTPRCKTNFGFYGGVTTFGQDNNDIALVIDNETGAISHNDSSPVTVDDKDGFVVNGPIRAKTNTAPINASYTSVMCTNDGGTVVMILFPSLHFICKYSDGNMTADGTLTVSGDQTLGGTTNYYMATGNQLTANYLYGNVSLTVPDATLSGHLSAGTIGSWSLGTGTISLNSGATSWVNVACPANYKAISCGYEWWANWNTLDLPIMYQYATGCSYDVKNNDSVNRSFIGHVECFNSNA